LHVENFMRLKKNFSRQVPFFPMEKAGKVDIEIFLKFKN